MHKLQPTFFARIFVAILSIIAISTAATGVAAQAEGTSYTDDTYGVTVNWTDSWSAELPTAESPLLSLERDSSIVVIISILDGASVSPEEAVWFLYADGDEILEDRSTENPAHLSLTLSDSGLVYTIEAYSVNDGEATVLVAMGTVPVLQSSAVNLVNEDISVNGSPVLTGEPIDGVSAGSDDATAVPVGRTSRGTGTATETAEPTEEAGTSGRISRDSRSVDEPEETEEADGRVSRTSRSGSEAAETPEATEEATTEITRTSRSGSEETPEATEEPTVEPTEEVVVTEDSGTYTGTSWGYSFTYDTELWERSDTFETETIDGVRLDGATATVSIIGLDSYGSDPVGCLMGENDYYGTQNENISDWEVATDSNGDQLWYESDELSWGVFTYTFHSSSGTDVEFVDYISCETIPGEDAVMIVQMTSFPDEYNNNLDAVLDILDTLEFQP